SPDAGDVVDTVVSSAAAEKPNYPPVVFAFPPSADESAVAVTMRNMSTHPLELTVTATDPSPSGNQSTVLVNVPGHGTTDLTQAGLVAEHGYELMVESRGYLTRAGVPVP
ncbi:MAG TPA: hypothetical protein VKB20_03420, partial [Steroidobacteraceae bacterium]|nr:hypothetical protein [Steroidobacteraceae bacterium]